MDNSCWITDRRPTRADGDEDGDVRVRYYSPNSQDYSYLHWSYVGANVPWKHCKGCEPAAEPAVEPAAEPAAEPPTTTPRRFVALTRTVHEFGHTLDAIADDGTAWWRVLPALEPLDAVWTQLDPLPVREVDAD